HTTSTSRIYTLSLHDALPISTTVMRTAQCSAVVLGVVVLDQLRLGRSLPEALRLGRGARGQEPQLALQVEQLLIRVGLHFDRLELFQQRVARQVLVHLGGGDQLPLF